MGFNIRKAISNDMIHVYTMTKELTEFDNVPYGPEIDDKQLIQDGFESKNPSFKCLIAECLDTKEVIGYAIYFPIYTTWQGRAMYLENLNVKREYRKQHIGLNLIKAVAKEAINDNCSRLDLHVLSTNPAMKLYEKLNAINLTESENLNVLRLDKNILASLAKE